MNRLERVWLNQIAYNVKIRELENPDDFEYWMKQYILGAISEVNEILDEINWKIHRRKRHMNMHNVGRELADLTKFVFCMWEWCGFDSTDMLNFVEEKTDEMTIKLSQEFAPQISENTPVVITDIDGTIGDFRKAFYMWLQNAKDMRVPKDPSKNMAMEIDLKLPFLEYETLKEEFESTGGYTHLEVYQDALRTLQDLDLAGVYIVAYTARPGDRHSRIWSDTWNWLDREALTCVSELHLGAASRITRACKLKEAGHKVVLLEDDPGLALRAAHAGISVFLRDQPYNRGVEHANILRRDIFEGWEIKAVLDG